MLFDHSVSGKEGYRFSLQPRRLVDYAEMCHLHQTSPESPFTRRRVCSRMTTSGRITLSDLRLIVTKRGVREERLLTEAKWRQVLEDTFGIDAALFALSPP
jgi:N-hydroxyarylamine O-acetyltransferase